MDDLLSSTSHVLSEASKGVGFAIAPPNAQALFQRIEFVPLSGSAHSRGHGRQRQPGVAENRGHRRIGHDSRAGAGGELPQLGILRAARSTRCAPAWSSACKQERSLYDQLLGLALRLASTSFENLDRPTSVYIDGTSTLLEEVVQASGISASTLRSVVADGRRKAAAGANAE